jgi:hypothetical protein
MTARSSFLSESAACAARAAFCWLRWSLPVIFAAKSEPIRVAAIPARAIVSAAHVGRPLLDDPSGAARASLRYALYRVGRDRGMRHLSHNAMDTATGRAARRRPAHYGWRLTHNGGGTQDSAYPSHFAFQAIAIARPAAGRPCSAPLRRMGPSTADVQTTAAPARRKEKRANATTPGSRARFCSGVGSAPRQLDSGSLGSGGCSMWGGTRTLQSGTGGPPSDPFPDRCSPLNGRIKTRRARPSAHVAHKRDRRHRCWIR